MRTVTPKQHARALAFRSCPLCTYDVATGEGQRSCHYYACPYLPELLDPTCPTCLYNFLTGEGAPECSDPPSCRFSREEAPVRVAITREWLLLHGRDPDAP